MGVIAEKVRFTVFPRLQEFNTYWALFEQLSGDHGLGDYDTAEEFLPLIGTAEANATELSCGDVDFQRFGTFLKTLRKNIKASHMEAERDNPSGRPEVLKRC
jgi:hypothetical protein